VLGDPSTDTPTPALAAFALASLLSHGAARSRAALAAPLAAALRLAAAAAAAAPPPPAFAPGFALRGLVDPLPLTASPATPAQALAAGLLSAAPWDRTPRLPPETELLLLLAAPPRAARGRRRGGLGAQRRRRRVLGALCCAVRRSVWARSAAGEVEGWEPRVGDAVGLL